MPEPSCPLPKPCSPKPFSTAGYLVWATLWAFFLPGLFIHGLPGLLIGIAEFFHGLSALLMAILVPRTIQQGEIALFVRGVVVLLACGLLPYAAVRFLIRFSASLRAERLPQSFTLRILPFWIPLYWGLALNTIAFRTAPESVSVCKIFIFFSAPQYFLPSTFFPTHESFVVGASIVNFLLAIVGTVYIIRFTPSVPKIRGLILCTAIALLLCWSADVSYKYFRTIIFPPHSDHEIIRDEPRTDHRQLDTDLSAYVPFQEDNKLVKIESPTLIIDSEHPKIHGAVALYPLYAAAVEATYRNIEMHDFVRHSYRYGRVQSGTSPEAFNALLDFNKEIRSDMIFMLQPSEKQLQEAKSKGVELVITPIGYEAFVFFVSTVNPVDGLTLEQIRNIYSKKITRWNKVGGKNEHILPFQRPEGSGSQTAMLRVMGQVPMAPPHKEEFRVGMGAIVQDVADYRNFGNAIGFSFRYYVEGLFKHDGVKLLSIDGIAPSIENIQNGTYPMIGELVIISRADNTNLNVPKLTEWFLSPQGQQLVREVGYVPIE